jgi:alpha-L-fucosidase
MHCQNPSPAEQWDIAPTADLPSALYRQQEGQFAVEHRATLRWHHQQVLLDVGAWLNVNGDAIYGTRLWRIYGEGPTKVAAGSFHDTDTTRYTAEDFRFTTKADVLYAIGLGWPNNGEVVIHSLALTAGANMYSPSPC